MQAKKCLQIILRTRFSPLSLLLANSRRLWQSQVTPSSLNLSLLTVARS